MKYFSFFILALILLIFDTNAFPSNNRWTPIPLTSAKQKQEGLAGGEGMQMVFGIAYAPSNPNVVYIVSDTSQVWKSRHFNSGRSIE
ncbi:MAG: hypothetical protein HZC10_06305 [Nitrospirae bacterium]|nr:hypothetical protein [Nitrospirota bacterium]